MSKKEHGVVSIGLEDQKRLKAFCEIKGVKQKHVVEKALSEFYQKNIRKSDIDKDRT